MIFKLIYILFNYKASLRSKIYGFSKRPNYEVYISSKKLCEFFGNLGIPFGAKSLTIKLPEIIKKCTDPFFWNFIRGIFDGDGSIIKLKTNWTFKIASGSNTFLEELNNLFLKKGFSPILRKERENIWILKLHKKDEINKIYSLIYKNPKKYYYIRKRLKWVNNNF
jgi:intein/homing endonuclease